MECCNRKPKTRGTNKCYALRIYGFVSVRAKYQSGEFIPKPFIFDGDKLLTNYATLIVGFIQVELLDTNQKPIKGFSPKDSKRIVGNEIERSMEWENNPNLKSMQDKVARLHL